MSHTRSCKSNEFKIQYDFPLFFCLNFGFSGADGIVRFVYLDIYWKTLMTFFLFLHPLSNKPVSSPFWIFIRMCNMIKSILMSIRINNSAFKEAIHHPVERQWTHLYGILYTYVDMKLFSSTILCHRHTSSLIFSNAL